MIDERVVAREKIAIFEEIEKQSAAPQFCLYWACSMLIYEQRRTNQLLEALLEQKEKGNPGKQIETVTEFRCGTETTYKDGTKDFQWSE